MKRSELRETVFRILFMRQFNTEEEMKEQAALYLDGLKEGREEVPYSEYVTAEDEAAVAEKLGGIMKHIPEIDTLLNQTSRGWKTSRMAKVDLSILRLAVYEMKYDDAVPTGVAINEAVELAKHYGGEESPSFVNGILGKIARAGSEDGAESETSDAGERQKESGASE